MILSCFHYFKIASNLISDVEQIKSNQIKINKLIHTLTMDITTDTAVKIDSTSTTTALEATPKIKIDKYAVQVQCSFNILQPYLFKTESHIGMGSITFEGAARDSKREVTTHKESAYGQRETISGY